MALKARFRHQLTVAERPHPDHQMIRFWRLQGQRIISKEVPVNGGTTTLQYLTAH